jgi:uncharacterized lipoprotein NlpE involved in copper resistance
MENAMFKKMIITVSLVIGLLGCGACGNHTQEPNIREMPGAEHCPDFCALMTDKGKTDSVCQEYADPTTVALDDGGSVVMSCTDWCVFEQKNSIQLNPGCMAKVSRCDQIDCASRLNDSQCTSTAEVDKLCP